MSTLLFFFCIAERAKHSRSTTGNMKWTAASAEFSQDHPKSKPQRKTQQGNEHSSTSGLWALLMTISPRWTRNPAKSSTFLAVPWGIGRFLLTEGLFFFGRCRARSKLWRSSIYWFRLSIENNVKRYLRCLPSNNQAATNTNKQQKQKPKSPTKKQTKNRTPRKKSETLRFQKSPHASQYSSAMK